MPSYYLETSALVKLYVREVGTELLLSIADRSAGNRLSVLSLSQVEFRSAIRRREKNGEIPSGVATGLLEAFQRHVEARFVTQRITDYVLDVATKFVDRHALRAFDAIQLAGYAVMANSAGSDVPFFVCADHELLAAARLEGAAILDPCSTL